MPSIGDICEYKKFKEFTGWEYLGNENFYDDLYYRTLMSSLNIGNYWYSITCVAMKPIRLLNPKKTYGINFTPCSNEDNMYKLPVNIDIENNITKYIPDFDFKSFDHSAKSYFEILMEVGNILGRNLMERVLFDYNLTDLKPFILKVN